MLDLEPELFCLISITEWVKGGDSPITQTEYTTRVLLRTPDLSLSTSIKDCMAVHTAISKYL